MNDVRILADENISNNLVKALSQHISGLDI